MGLDLEHRVTCVLVDDHPAILKALAAILRDDGIDVAGVATTGAEGIDLIECRRPAVALVDLRLPDVEGIDVVRSAAAASSVTSCAVYTGQADRTQAQDALDAGARGIVLKESPLTELSRAIRLVAGGGLYVDPLLGGLLVARPRSPLSPRQRDVLRLLATGLTNDQIGERIFLSPETVRTHIKNATERLGARNRLQAVADAVRAGLI
jgi:two-component system response regulator DesR